MKRRWALTIALFGLTAGLIAQGQIQPPVSLKEEPVISARSEPVMAIDQKLFLQVPLNSREQNLCSPLAPGPAWRGIMIHAPIQVKFKPGTPVGDKGAFAAIPICGYYLIDAAELLSGEPPRLVAVDQRTSVVYTGDLIEREASPEAPPPDEPPLDPASLKGIAIGSYFNPNLADYVELPAVPASYAVHVEYGRFQSNVVKIEVVRE